MYIAPTSIIRFLSNCPLDNTYSHTLYFETASEQEVYFASLAKYTLNNQSYQRAQRGVMRVALAADALYTCNYIMFQNTEYGNKWFYAFITGVEYVNNATTEVTYEIDVMQTYLFDVQMEESFVEREHAATDYVGENTVDEGLETGDYITTNKVSLTLPTLMVYGMTTELLSITNLIPHFPGIKGGFPLPVYTWLLGRVDDDGTPARIKLFTDSFAAAGKAESIVSLFCSPLFDNDENWTTGSTSTGNWRATTELCERSVPLVYRNNKLSCAPYCWLVLSSAGQAVQLRYELFIGAPKALACATFGPGTNLLYIPLSYAGESESLSNSISSSNFPLCAWSSAYYQNWIAQNRLSQAFGFANVAHSVATQAAAGNVPGFLSAASNVHGVIAQSYQASITPDTLRGPLSAPDILSISGRNTLYSECKTVRPEYGRIIDDYFTMYGYATRRVKVPNRNARPHWTYTKTVGCNAIGNVPADDLKRICQIYDAGVTFWKNGSEVGNYSLDNNEGIPPHRGGTE